MIEIWKDIKGYEGLYQVSNLGRVRSLDRTICFTYKGYKKQMRIKSKIRVPVINRTGYYMISLCKNNIHDCKLISRLVAETFIPNPENKPQVDHINTIRTDNRAENLRWCTQQENTDNPISKNKHKAYYTEHIGKKHHCAKKCIQLTTKGEIVKIWESIVDAYLETGIDRHHISACCNNKRKSAGGYNWEFAA